MFINGKVVNLTQHAPTEQQLQAASEWVAVDTTAVKEVITFTGLPTAAEIGERAVRLAEMAVAAGAEYAHVGGAPYFMGAVERELLARGVKPVYSFTERKVKEVVGEDGAVTKTAVFEFAGWIHVVD